MAPTADAAGGVPPFRDLDVLVLGAGRALSFPPAPPGYVVGEFGRRVVRIRREALCAACEGTGCSGCKWTGDEAVRRGRARPIRRRRRAAPTPDEDPTP